MNRPFVGLDFGTTNSAIAVATPEQEVNIATFELFEEQVQTFRSVLYFSFDQRDERGQPKVWAGPKAIEAYLEEDGLGRLILSPKSTLASHVFDHTQILRKRYHLEELIAIILRFLTQQARSQFGSLGTRVVAGRPVRFVNAKSDEDEQRAITRLKRAINIVGFEEITFEYEPVAAAYSYEATLSHDETVLVADFGGGTTDFCIMQVGPSHRDKPSEEKILGIHGVPIAGDAFDGQLVQQFIAPHLGLASSFRSQFGEALPMPVWPYSKLSQWHLIALLHEPKTLSMLHEIQARSSQPDKVSALLECIEGNFGFHLYQCVEQTKVRLSSKEHTTLLFDALSSPIEGHIPRPLFESWISPQIQDIATCCDQILSNTNLQPHQIDRVFMTGGTSFVPSVRQIFIERFGAQKLGTGNELTSVVSGLARMAQHKYS